MLRSRVALAIIGVLLFGGVGASLGVLSTARPAASSLAAAPTDTAATTPVTATATPTTAPQPVATAIRTPRPTPTPLPIGVSFDVHGRIVSVNSGTQTFVLQLSGGATYTVQTSGSTAYSGTATSFAGLQPGWVAEVHGTIPSAGAPITATEVNAQPDN